MTVVRHEAAVRALSWPAARDLAARSARPLPPADLPLSRALGCRLAGPLRALVAVPGSDVSAMDGYAVAGAPPWRVVGRVLAGGLPYGDALWPGEAVEIATGAPVPPGSESVLPYERASGGSWVDGRIEAGRHIRRRGEDIAEGAVVLGAGAVVTPVVAGLAAALGHDILTVRPVPSVAVLVTGDEVVDHGLPGPGRVRDAIGPFLPGLIDWAGGRLTSHSRLPDGAAPLHTALSAFAPPPHPRQNPQEHLSSRPGENPPPREGSSPEPRGEEPSREGFSPGKNPQLREDLRFRSGEKSPPPEGFPPREGLPPREDLRLFPDEGRPPREDLRVRSGEESPPREGLPSCEDLRVLADEGREAREDLLARSGEGGGVEVVVVCGASSRGPADHLRGVLGELGAEVLVDGVAVRPGHPQLLARLPGGTLVVGLPGNPFAALAAAMTLLVPVLRGMRGAGVRRESSALAGAVRAHERDTRLVPVLRSGRGAIPVGHDRPGSLWGAALAEALAVVPPGWSGEQVELIELPTGG
ncbi:molybdopterin-binding protein [Nonomuraea harbinensis]|uniref:Molybdopterin molybdenumtransferase n=1 Tax=Nonomuraea harbinensis TaxID=1286938 RepID=A0ABW1BVI2_9ACTN|nr:molybdopterin-binding protein [Nonomuraea harbinensis]